MNLLTKASQAVTTQAKSKSYVKEFRLPIDSMEVIVSYIDGNYPEEGGFDIDEAVDQIWYVESGTGNVFIKDTEYNLEPGDALLVPKNEKYWIKGKKLKLVVASDPKWFPDQHKHISK